jgi:hypothetical protein
VSYPFILRHTAFKLIDVGGVFRASLVACGSRPETVPAIAHFF